MCLTMSGAQYCRAQDARFLWASRWQELKLRAVSNTWLEPGPVCFRMALGYVYGPLGGRSLWASRQEELEFLGLRMRKVGVCRPQEGSSRSLQAARWQKKGFVDLRMAIAGDCRPQDGYSRSLWGSQGQQELEFVGIWIPGAGLCEPQDVKSRCFQASAWQVLEIVSLRTVIVRIRSIY